MNSIIDDLILIRYLNSGCFSETYLSIKRGSNKLYATKKISLEMISQEQLFKENIKNEIMILNQIKHPNIVELYEVKVKKDYVYLIMEYCNGGSLLEVLSNYIKMHERPFTEKIVQFLMKQILSAVDYLHKNGIIHRDLKLENILLKYNSQSDAKNQNIFSSKVKIIDFNISSKKNNYNYQMNGEESLYMNPAFFINEFNDIVYDEKIDIWALGVLCYEMFTGKKPFKIDYFVRSMDSINITFPKNISLLARSFLSCMLCKNRNKRLNASQLLNHEFIIKNLDEIQMNNIQLIRQSYIENNPVKKMMNTNIRNSIQIPHIRDISVPFYQPQQNKTIQLRYSMQPKTKTRSIFGFVKKPLFKKYYVGSNIDNNKLKIIINCCYKYYIQFKGEKNTAKLSSEAIQKLLGDDWLVFISNIKCRDFDFYLSPAQKNYIAVFSLDNKFFQVCKYKII